MIHCHSLCDLETALTPYRLDEVEIAFVPTMGHLHDGHLSLIHAAKKKARCVVVSLFVNPTQFGQNEDFSTYPRTLEEDLAQCQEAGVTLVFTPSIPTLYPFGPTASTTITVPHLSSLYCGKSRPHFFIGVCTVLIRFFQIIKPQHVILGEKDFQQVCIVKHMIQDLFFPIQVHMCPVIREANGLALSSRNTYLTSTQQQQASSIYRALCDAKTYYTTSPSCTASMLYHHIYKTLDPNITIDYCLCINSDSLAETPLPTPKSRFIFAGYLGKTRLIDTLALSVSPSL